jgi:hypothetical protein
MPSIIKKKLFICVITNKGCMVIFGQKNIVGTTAQPSKVLVGVKDHVNLAYTRWKCQQLTTQFQFV